MKITVLIPTYRRCQDLERCLNGLKEQTRPPDEILLVIRDTDIETWEFLKTLESNDLPTRLLTVTVPGVIAALNIGLDAAQGDIIAITDDDASPHPDWLARIEAHFEADPCIAGVGGRDWVYHGTHLENGSRQIVGKLQWFGRVIGNHHIGVGEAREVDVLKGVNMSYRRLAMEGLRLDSRLQGTGAQVHYEIGFCLSLRRAGWKLIYDPKVAVDHYPSERFDSDQRNQFDALAMTNAVCNETLMLLDHLSLLQRLVFLLWAILIGTRQSMGLVQWLRFLPHRGAATQKLFACLQGRWQGYQLWQYHQGDRPLSPNSQIRTSN